MNLNKDTYIIIGTLVSIVMLVLYLKNQEGSGPRVEPVFQVNAPDPQIAAIASGERVAGIQANRDISLAWLQYKLGFKNADTNLAISQVQATRDTTIAKTNADATVQSVQLASDAQRYTAALNQDVQLANIRYQDKASSRQAWTSAITGIGKTILGIFGL